MYNRLLRFLKNHNILSVNQYGFRKHHSTAYALACLYDISKLEHHGVLGTALRWFKSYLSNGQQYVEVNGISSETCEIKSGVSQGSILGPCSFCSVYMICAMCQCDAQECIKVYIFGTRLGTLSL